MMLDTLLTFVNRRLDRLVRSELYWRGFSLQPFRILGIAGFMLAFAFTQGLALALPTVSVAVMALLTLIGAVVFYGYVMTTKILFGQEMLSNLYQQLLTLLVFVITLKVLQQPILPYLDVTLLGLGVIIACGRLGCLMIGCCHGVPCRFGVTYSSDHVGFSPLLVGVRLFPVQLLESLMVWVIVGVGLVLLVNLPPGAVTIWYGYSYAAGRIILETLRGDTHRGYMWGLSVPQWLALAVIFVLTVWVLSFWTAALVIAGEIGVIVRLRRTVAFTPREMEGFVQVLAQSHASPSKIVVDSTKSGVMLSMGVLQDTIYYTLSRQPNPLTHIQARVLGRLIGHVRYAGQQPAIIPGHQGIYHVIFENYRQNTVQVR